MSIDILTLAAARAGKGGGSASKYKQPEWGAETGIVDILPETAISVGETMEGVIEPRDDYSGSYSPEYSTFYGKGTEYAPVLTVTYK